MKNLRSVYQDEELELDNMYNEEEERGRCADSSIWYN